MNFVVTPIIPFIKIIASKKAASNRIEDKNNAVNLREKAINVLLKSKVPKCNISKKDEMPTEIFAERSPYFYIS